MKLFRWPDIILFLTLVPFAFSSCGLYVKDSHEIKTNGFISDNCYQALLEIDPDESSRGLVARRESAYLKAKNVDMKDMAVRNLANYCIDSQSKTGLKDKNRKEAYPAELKNDLVKKLKGIVMGGNISFVYYNEKGSMIVGYRFFKVSFKKKLADIMASPAEQKQEASITTPGARS